MTGSIQGFSTRLSGDVAEHDPLYRIWCLAHQLDIVVKAWIVNMHNLTNFSFEKTLTTLIAYLRRQEALIREMGSKCPYWITVRWKSMSNVLQWQLKHRFRINHFAPRNNLDQHQLINGGWWQQSCIRDSLNMSASLSLLFK